MTNPDMVVLPSAPNYSLNEKASIDSFVSSNMAFEMAYPLPHDTLSKINMHPRHGRETVGYELGRRLQSFQQKQASLEMDGDTDIEYSFFIADLGEVYRQFLRWKRNLPRIEPFYAVKCNPDPYVLRLLASLGVGFDCASKDEIGKVLALEPVVPHRNIIFANPCKANPQIRYAQQVDVKMMTFDNADELHKCKQHYPNAQLLLRIWTDDSKSQCQLSRKFGASEESIRPLLKLAKLLQLNVIGISFHVGSGSHDPGAFVSAVDMARRAFDTGRDVGFNFSILDVGGGFCHEDFETVARVLGEKVDEQFPPEMGVRIIAEPGRYFVASAFTLATNVIARRVGFVTEANPEQSYMCMFAHLHTILMLCRLFERRRLRKFQLHPVRSSESASQVTISRRFLLLRQSTSSHRRKDLQMLDLGSHLRWPRLHRSILPTPRCPGSRRLALFRRHGSLHHLRRDPIQRLPGKRSLLRHQRTPHRPLCGLRSCISSSGQGNVFFIVENWKCI
jgi:diaminopimelate decarboxylase